MITCVCTANICRSPMAERLLAHALAVEKNPLNTLKVVSCGISAIEGEAASPNSVKALKNVGIDLDNHSSRQISLDLLKRSALVLCMTESHRYYTTQIYPEIKAPVMLMRDLMPPGSDPQIPDPFGLNLSHYEACRDSMVEAIPHIIKFLKENTEQLIKV